MEFSDEEDLLEQIRPGIDGLVIEDMGRRGTFLPSVWEQLPDKRQFLGERGKRGRYTFLPASPNLSLCLDSHGSYSPESRTTSRNVETAAPMCSSTT